MIVLYTQTSTRYIHVDNASGRGMSRGSLVPCTHADLYGTLVIIFLNRPGD